MVGIVTVKRLNYKIKKWLVLSAAVVPRVVASHGVLGRASTEHNIYKTSRITHSSYPRWTDMINSTELSASHFISYKPRTLLRNWISYTLSMNMIYDFRVIVLD